MNKRPHARVSACWCDQADGHSGDCELTPVPADELCRRHGVSVWACIHRPHVNLDDPEYHTPPVRPLADQQCRPKVGWLTEETYCTIHGRSAGWPCGAADA